MNWARAVTDTSIAAGIELVIGGMTCGSCAARIERRLNRLDGVVAPSTTPPGGPTSLAWAAVTR